MRGYTHFYTKEDWDLLVVYNIDDGSLAVLDWDDIGDKIVVNLRTQRPKNNQKKGVMMFEDYIPQ